MKNIYPIYDIKRYARSRKTKNPDVSTGPLVRPTAHPFARTARPFARTVVRSLASLTHSLVRSLTNLNPSLWESE